MHINYTPEYGFSWQPTLIGREQIKAVHGLWDNAGVYYVLAFGLPISPHSYEFDMEKRDSQVIEEIKARKITMSKTGGKLPTAYYKDPMCRAAIDAANQMICTPSQIYKYELESRIKKLQNEINSAVWDKDPEKRNKALIAEKSAFDLITKYRAEQRVEEIHLNKMVSRTGLISLDELFD